MTTQLDPETLGKALRRAFQLGQTYWQQADSDCLSQHRKADVTMAAFRTLLKETVSLLEGQL